MFKGVVISLVLCGTAMCLMPQIQETAFQVNRMYAIGLRHDLHPTTGFGLDQLPRLWIGDASAVVGVALLACAVLALAVEMVVRLRRCDAHVAAKAGIG